MLGRGLGQGAERRVGLGPDAAQFPQEDVDRGGADAGGQLPQTALQIIRVRGGCVQAFQGALIARLQRLHDLQQLGGGLEIITRVAALVQEHHQVVPTLAQDGFRGVDSGCHEGPEGAGGQGPGNTRPKKDGGQEPLLARPDPDLRSRPNSVANLPGNFSSNSVIISI